MKLRSVSLGFRLWRLFCFQWLFTGKSSRLRSSAVSPFWLPREEKVPRLDTCTLITGQSSTWWVTNLVSSSTVFLFSVYGPKILCNVGSLALVFYAFLYRVFPILRFRAINKFQPTKKKKSCQIMLACMWARALLTKHFKYTYNISNWFINFIHFTLLRWIL